MKTWLVAVLLANPEMELVVGHDSGYVGGRSFPFVQVNGHQPAPAKDPSDRPSPTTPSYTIRCQHATATHTCCVLHSLSTMDATPLTHSPCTPPDAHTTVLPVSRAPYPVPCTPYPVPRTLYPVPCTLYPVPVPRTLYPVPHTLYPYPSLYPYPYHCPWP